MKAARTFILLLLLLLCAGASARAAVADGDSAVGTLDLRGESNVTFSQRTDGSKLVDVYYTLDGGTSSVALGVSLDGGTTFSSVTTLSGDVGAAVSAGTAKHIVWNAGTDQPGAGYPNVKMRVTALLDGAGGSFAPIPGGTYQMGNLIGDSDITNAGTVSVTLNPYYMAVNDTTKAQWDTVRTWAATNGYTDLAVGAGKAANHPVQTVTWSDVVKWANAASEKEGLTPCYQVSGSVVRTGTSNAVTCDWTANGYRLPTEAEWEVAARGGLSGKRFPWGDTISQTQANYKASTSFAYDTSGSVNDYHPTYKSGGNPYTNPVGSFAANGYGLYDMAGDVFQWCWDWYGTPCAGGTDPRGAGSGSFRVLRGGNWFSDAYYARSARRNYYSPSNAFNYVGFRLARGRSSGSGSGTQSVGGVVDTTPPIVTVPAAVTVDATSASGTAVPLSGASATDNLGGTPTLTYSPASGSTFPVGTTTVTVTATDSMGNTASGTYSVTVSPVTVTPQATGVTFSQRTDGSKLVDVYYTLDGGTSSVALGVSLDGGTTFSSVTTLTGDVGAAVSAGTAKHIVWNAGTDQPSAGYPNVKMRVTALLDGAGGTFAPIPGGTYQMGNLIGDSDITDAAPVTVTLSPYYVAVNHTTKAQWDAVRTWASSNGYTDLLVGLEKASNHPVQTVSWYDAVKWANAASEKEGLTPCYKVSGAVYRSGANNAVTCDWSASGYRLPTEAEWEVAARGGLSGKRFPWGDTISQSQANYKASTSYVYDLSGAVSDFHPTYKTGAQPYTSPVGSFAANGYGLCDLVGNVWQWCWDWYGTPYGAGTDPRGTAIGSNRVLRGGAWNFDADCARSARRNSGGIPTSAFNDLGFRLARGRSSGTGTGTLSTGGAVDTTPPVVTVPAAVTVDATSASGANVTLSGASATDNLGGTPTLTYSPASGSNFPVGTTAVTVTATDSVGNTASGTYSVTVSPVTVTPQATGVTFSQRTDGSKLVDVCYTLNGGTSSVALGVSLDGGTTFTSVKTLSGDVGAAVSAGTAKHIVWNAGTDQPGAGYPNVKMRVTALLDGAGGTFAPIPGGTYQMGNLIGDSDITDAVPVTVTLSPYYMSVNDTTKAQWDTVRTWATGNGYTALAAGAGKASNHPVQMLKWDDVVKWVNAASEKEGLTPCYKVSGAVYRTGTSNAVTCDWSANGYRLPTEAEWEIAARGGLSGKRFPWGDTISQGQANYKASTSYAYDLSGAVNDYLPTYKAGATPYTSPVGSFAANGYGLYDMAGNVWQWCWDWYGTPYAGGADPRGALTGSSRVLRGGGWYNDAHYARVANRDSKAPTLESFNYGFRLARGRPSGPETGTLSAGGAVDTTPPVVTVPGAVSVDATSASGASVTLSGATATDNLGGTPTLTYSPASGSTFPVGTTTVTVTATDSMGNVATGTFNVIVSAPPVEATGVTFSQRTDGSKLVDVYYTLDGGTSSVVLGVSLDGGTTFSSVKTLTGDVGAAVSAGTAKHIVWNAGTDQPGAGYPNVKMRVTALLDGAGGTFAPIPGGTYQMGNLIGDSDITNAVPVTVTLSPYYMSVNDTTKAQWDTVRTWATGNGYTDLVTGAGKASNHPVQTVSWYDAVKWANAASEKEGLTPCYRGSGAVYRTGTNSAVTCDWSANGYRLPTEAEWEIAARGGLSGKRFPWGNTISQSQANYSNNPTYTTGAPPFTSPVGSFAANGHGLFDMAGNVQNWCWDWYGTPYAVGTDPRGVATGSARVLRGCDWSDSESLTRCASRYFRNPLQTGANGNDGFRLARGRSSGTGTGTLSGGGVVDTTPPVVTVPGAVSVDATSASGANVTLSGASATDNLGGTPTLTYSPASGSTFPVGTTTVTVTATDSVGNTANNTFQVTVNAPVVPPTILTQPDSLTVTAGSIAAFRVVATGGSLGYQWRKGGNAIAGGTLATLAIASAQTLDAGSYDVVVTNAGGSLTSSVATLTVNTPPSIATQPVGAAVNPGVGVTFSVVANGTAPLAYQWRKNGVPIAGGTAASYAVAAAQTMDVANYDVVVTNAAGSVSSNTATLSLNAAPVITMQPLSVAANMSAAVVFSVTAEGTAPLTYQWRKGGTNIVGATGATYAIASAQLSDVGSYDVVVTNVAGAATSTTAVLTLNSAPVIVTQPPGGTLNPGATVTLNVTASGTLPLSYQWRKNGVAISGATSGSLKFSAVQPADAGSYEVVVTNVAGSATSAAAVLALNTGVTLLTQPVALSVPPGDSATFSVAAEGTAPLSYQWRRNGVSIAGATSASYTVAAAQSTDAGNYDVAVTNVVGAVTSSVAALTLSAPVTLTTQPVGGALNPGASKTLSVTAAGAAPLSYQWRLNGSAIAGATTAVYTLSNAADTNVGSYDVVVTNVVGSVFSNTAVVTLNTAVSIVTQPDSFAANPGKAASFSVLASGTAPLSYQWRKNGVPISGATASTYSIAAAQSTHTGNYDVIVTNAVGSVTSAFATLTLNTPVTITTQPTGAAVNTGTSVAFSVVAGGTAPLTYQWRRNGTAVPGATAATYTVASVQGPDAGAYDVEVSNVVGSVFSSPASLSINLAPVLVLQPLDGAANPGGSLSFSVGATGTAPLVYQWRKGGAAIAGATMASYTVLNAQAADVGSYDAVVTNVAGSVTSNAAALTLNTPVSITGQPASQSLVLLTGTTFSVTAGGTAPLSYQWRRNGTAIAGATAATYTIGAAQTKDAGSYDVEVTNIVGSVWSSVAVLSVLTPPSITTQPVGGAVNPGGSRTLSVVGAGTALLNYQWQWNGADIPGATSATYTLANAQASDAGAYTVAVRNVAGSVTSSPAVVTVNVPVTINVQPAGVSVASGSPATLSVAATGTAPLTYQWRKDGVAIAGATGATYTISSVKAASVGGYDVLVGNTVGNVSSDVAAVALTPPAPAAQPTAVTFTGQLASVGLNPGADVTLSVPFTGVGTFSYQWRKNGVAIAGATGATYTLLNAQAGDAGSYDLVVTNETGSYTSNSATLALNTPVSILMHPLAATVNPGTLVTLSVAATGTGPLSYKWRKDGQVLAGATSASYVLGSASASNIGTYDVVVSNMVGSATSDPALVALNKGVSIVTQPLSATVNPGGMASFSVAATGTGPLSYQWLRGGVGLAGATSAALTVTNAQSGDVGNYSVVVGNVVGSVTSTVAALALNALVTIVSQPADVAVNPAGAATLRVSATGTAPLAYQWSRNGVPIEGATSATYAIVSASAAVTGAYTVEVTNVAGSVTSVPAQVRLNIVPTIAVQPMSVSVNPGGTTSLAVQANGTSPLSYQWRFNGGGIAGATSATYTLTNAQAAKAGSYDVVVSNVAGSVASASAAVVLNLNSEIRKGIALCKRLWLKRVAKQNATSAPAQNDALQNSLPFRLSPSSFSRHLQTHHPIRGPHQLGRVLRQNSSHQRDSRVHAV